MLTTRIKDAIGCGFRRLGFQIIALPRLAADRALYDSVAPVATYAPWNTDDEFRAVFEKVKTHSMVDLYRFWELWKLVEQSSKLPRGSLLEVGVWRGGTGSLIAKRAAACGIRETVYLCDTFRGIVKAGKHDTYHQRGEHADTSRDGVEDFVFNKMHLNNVQVLEGVFPDDTAHIIEKQESSFRLCHIDVDVYESAKDIMNWVWDRMVAGGIIVFDDYGFCGCEGILKLVNEQAGEKDRLVFHNLNGHAVVVKLSPRYTSPSGKRNIAKGRETAGHECGQYGAVSGLDLGETVIDTGTELSGSRVIAAPQGVLLHDFPQPLDQVEVW